MGALTMALAAALLAGSGAEKVSGETRQVLDLSGEWKGGWQNGRGDLLTASLAAGDEKHSSRFIRGRSQVRETILPLNRIQDQGNGRLHVEVLDGFLGIYKMERGQVVLCFRPAPEGYPMTFKGGSGQHLITLRRVRCGK